MSTSYKAWFEDTWVQFSVNESQACFFDANRITELAQELLREQGCDPLLSEVEWEIL